MLEEIISGKWNASWTNEFKLAPRIVCKDGISLSVQASKYNYCRPRDDSGPYTHVEVGFPSVLPPSAWNEYKDNQTDLDNKEDVWAYVPVELVREFVQSHGGERKY